jgi:ubiquinone/menaquinone biosynthesis C-methylase UbiE
MGDSAYFSTRLAYDPARAEVWRHVARYLQRWVDRDGALLDVAAGYADFTASIEAGRKVAIDVDAGLSARAGAGIECHVGDAVDLSRFADGEFATVFASNFLEHLTHEQLDVFLPEVRRVLRAGGRFVIVQPNFRLSARTYFDDYTHRTVFTDRSLPDRLAAAGFAVVHVEPRFLPMTMKSRLSRAHRLVPLYLRLPYRPRAGQMLVVAEPAPR